MNTRSFKIGMILGLLTLAFTFTNCDNTTNATVNPPVIVTQPVSVSTTAGSGAIFTVVATGDSLSYQWVQESDGANIQGAIAASLYFTNVTTAMNGSKYHCDVKNAGGTVTTTTATLTVTAN